MKRHDKHGPRVDVGEGITIGLHGVAGLRNLTKFVKAAQIDGLTDDEVLAIAEGPGLDFLKTLIGDIREALED